MIWVYSFKTYIPWLTGFLASGPTVSRKTMAVRYGETAAHLMVDAKQLQRWAW